MYEVYITKVVDGVGEYTDTYMRRELGKIFDDAGVHVFTVKKTDMAWGVNKRQWHEAFEVLYCVKEEDLEKTTVIVYLINKAFSGAKAVYSIREVESGVKAFYMGSHSVVANKLVEKESNKYHDPIDDEPMDDEDELDAILQDVDGDVLVKAIQNIKEGK